MSISLEIKEENRNRVYNSIRTSRGISASNLSYELQLSRPTIKQNLDELLNNGHIYESGSLGYTGGRRAKVYSITALSKISIGLDITRNHISLFLVNLYGEQIYEERIRCCFEKTDAYFKQIGDMVLAALASSNIPHDAVLGVGMAVPGLTTNDNKQIYYGEILNFTGISSDDLGRYLPFPCFLYNDANAAAYAEKSLGYQSENAFYISLSNNIGGAVWIHGELYAGDHSRAGEVGHMTIIPNGESCYCGQRGCFETYCNAQILSARTDGNLAEFFELVRSGDAESQAVLDHYLDYLAIAVNNVRMVYDCNVILGGYLSEFLPEHLELLRAKVACRSSFDKDMSFLKAGQVKRGALAIGSALPFIHNYWKRV